MSVFGNIGKALKKGVVDVGHFVGKAASNPIVQGVTAMIPGLGVPISALEGAVGGLLKPGGNIGGAITGGLKGAASGAVGKGVKGIGSYLLGGGGLGGLIKGGGADNKGNFGAIGDALGTAAGSLGLGGGGDGKGGLGGLLDSLGLGGVNPALLGLGVAQIKNVSDLQKKASGYATGALDQANKSYGERAPLRAAGIQGMLNPQTRDLSGLLTNSGPYAKGLLPAQSKVASLNQYA